MSLKFYEDLSWFGKILYRLRLRKAIKKFAYRDVDNTLMLEQLERDDVIITRYLDYLLNHSER